jgi:2-oxoglutarate ferredoxin oxidoreductase subunit alpha
MTGTWFINGDTACAEGAIAAGCRFFAGYPITPATEVAERMAERLPKLGGVYIQMEDEIASMAAIIGAAWGGAKTMTSTSGPGFSLMMENLGLAVVTETPCVVVDVQRAGPSTGLPTAAGQGDMMQARWGSHGPYEIIALCPSSPQELFDLTVRAFNLSERFRLPVLVMTDEVVGHMTEKVVIPPVAQIAVAPRRPPSKPPGQFLLYQPGPDGIVEMPAAGDGYRVHVTGLTHDRRGYPALTPEAQKEMVERLVGKIRDNADEIVEVEERDTADAEVVIVAYGITVRPALQAVALARREGIRAGLLKIVTAWPFPEKSVRALATRVPLFVVPEINYGQMALEVERCAAGAAKTVLIPYAGGRIHTPEMILKVVREQLAAVRDPSGRETGTDIFSRKADTRA